jgi:hypothetical protein
MSRCFEQRKLAFAVTEQTLTLRELNRATLARQALLARENSAPLTMIERLVGLQAQMPNPPYIGL